jgi:hypothetical protein
MPATEGAEDVVVCARASPGAKAKAHAAANAKAKTSEKRARIEVSEEHTACHRLGRATRRVFTAIRTDGAPRGSVKLAGAPLRFRFA